MKELVYDSVVTFCGGGSKRAQLSFSRILGGGTVV